MSHTNETPIEILKQMLREPIDPHKLYYLKQSRDFWTHRSGEEMDAIAEDFAKEYREVVARIGGEWGEPDYSGDWESQGFPEWCPAIEMSCWRKGDRLACVWWEHPDTEFPFGLVLHVALDTEDGY